MQEPTGFRTIRIPLGHRADVSLALYPAAADGRLTPERVADLASQWASRNLDRAACDEIRQVIVEEGRLGIHVLPRRTRKKPRLALSPWQQELYRQSTHVVTLDAVGAPVHERRPLLRALAAAACGLAESGDTLIVEPRTQQVLDAGQLSSLAHAPVPPVGLLTTLESAWEPSGLRLGTRGLEAFGLPEVEVREVPASAAQLMACAVEAVAAWLVDQLPPASEPPAPHVEILPELVLRRSPQPHDALALAVLGAVEEARFPLPAGQGAVRLRFGLDGSRGRGVVRLIPPRAIRLAHPCRPAATWMRELKGLLSRSLCLVPEHSELMEVAHRRAVAQLGEVRERFQKGLAIGESLYVKRGFEAPGQGIEFMWIEVTGWSSGHLGGVLCNEPVLCPGLTLGQAVIFPEEDVFDWALHLADGSVLGNLTTRVARMAAPGEAREAVSAVSDP